MTKKPKKSLPSDPPTQRVYRAFIRLGFVDAGGKKHIKLRGPRGTAQLPRHTKVKTGLLQGLLERLKISEEEFMEHYR